MPIPRLLLIKGVETTKNPIKVKVDNGKDKHIRIGYGYQS